jgi:hypothetical protein
MMTGAARPAAEIPDEDAELEPAPQLSEGASHAICGLIAGIIAADGIVDPDELAIAYQAGGRFGLTPDAIDAELKRGAPDLRAGFAETLLKVANDDREAAASLLFELASADERLDRREAELLQAMKEAWGVTVSFLNRPITWDEDQQLVIEAGRSDRILVAAGPGMGKTSVACARVAYLIDQEYVADNNIWLVSFTRAAIAEIKGRIADFAEDPSNVFAVKISTIDSQAWKIRYGFSPEEVERLFGGFETGIVAATELLGERAEEIKDAFGDLEHLIIDEAQDIIGDRARFLLALIKLLPESCGLTVFHDPAQAIYDHDEAGAPFRFTDGLKELFGDGLQDFALRRIYRTDEPALLRLYEDLRLDILGNADCTAEDFKARAELVRQAAHKIGKGGFDQTELSGYDDALVLFRKRIEVAQASSFMAGDGLAHRLRMSGLPRVLHPWLALCLSPHDGKTITREEFRDLHAGAAVVAPKCMGIHSDDLADRRFDQMLRHARGKTDDIDLHRLRARLASHPPDEFILPEFGQRGPILGTIHASKGREADHVFLQISSSWGGKGDTEQLSEESRVLFVGATRARRSLAVQGGYGFVYGEQTESGRCFRRSRKYRTGCQVQVGLAGDFDIYSSARLVLPVDELAETETPFACIATLEKGSWIYHLMTAKGRLLGSIGQSLSRDLMEIGRNRLKIAHARSPDRIENIYVLGFGSAVAAPGDPRLEGAKGRAAASGFWVIPQVTGLPMAFFR